MKTRILTATVLILGVLWIIFFAPAIIFTLLLGLFLAGAAWEWAGLIPVRTIGKGNDAPRATASRPYKMLFVFIVELMWIGFSFWPAAFHGLLYFNAVLLLIMIPALLTYPKTAAYWHSPLMVTVMGFSFLVTATLSLGFLKAMPEGQVWLMSVLLLTWLMDTGAYFAGRFWGKRKFIPLVSPNKTWAGFWGGFILSELVVHGFGIAFIAKTVGWEYWMLMGTLAILGAVFGDLFISMLKRCVQVKDTGCLLPGHGGILDRVDSLLISAFVLVFFLAGNF